MAFDRLSFRESLRDIEACLLAQSAKLYAADTVGVDLEETVYALDLTTVNVCLPMFRRCPEIG